MAAGQEKEGELATTSLKYLHRKSRCEMLIGQDDISNDVVSITNYPWQVLSCVFQCLFTFGLVSASR